jgi:hypothetical protein
MPGLEPQCLGREIIAQGIAHEVGGEIGSRHHLQTVISKQEPGISLSHQMCTSRPLRTCFECLIAGHG